MRKVRLPLAHACIVTRPYATMTLERQIKDKALEIGFDAVGITDASAVDPSHVERFKAWLTEGRAGQMQYLHRNLDKRFDPALLLYGAKSVIVVALNCKPPDGPERVEQRSGPFGTVAQYACYDDYHTFIKAMLHRLADVVGPLVLGRGFLPGYDGLGQR